MKVTVVRKKLCILPEEVISVGFQNNKHNVFWVLNHNSHVQMGIIIWAIKMPRYIINIDAKQVYGNKKKKKISIF